MSKKTKPQPTPRPRKLARSVARANMEKSGVKKMNRKFYAVNSPKKASYFSMHWKKYAS